MSASLHACGSHRNQAHLCDRSGLWGMKGRHEPLSASLMSKAWPQAECRPFRKALASDGRKRRAQQGHLTQPCPFKATLSIGLLFSTAKGSSSVAFPQVGQMDSMPSRMMPSSVIPLAFRHITSSEQTGHRFPKGFHSRFVRGVGAAVNGFMACTHQPILPPPCKAMKKKPLRSGFFVS